MVGVLASATSTRLRRYTGRRATVASGIRRLDRSTLRIVATDSDDSRVHEGTLARSGGGIARSAARFLHQNAGLGCCTPPSPPPPPSWGWRSPCRRTSGGWTAGGDTSWRG